MRSILYPVFTGNVNLFRLKATEHRFNSTEIESTPLARGTAEE